MIPQEKWKKHILPKGYNEATIPAGGSHAAVTKKNKLHHSVMMKESGWHIENIWTVV